MAGQGAMNEQQGWESPGFFPVFGGSVAWQAHVGGLAGGLLTGLILTETRRLAQRPLQIGLLIALGVVVILEGIYPVLF